MPSGFVYILASKRNGTLYIGVTSDLHTRMQQHAEGQGSHFVKNIP
jgi:putative endonuclease